MNDIKRGVIISIFLAIGLTFLTYLIVNYISPYVFLFGFMIVFFFLNYKLGKAAKKITDNQTKVSAKFAEMHRKAYEELEKRKRRRKSE